MDGYGTPSSLSSPMKLLSDTSVRVGIRSRACVFNRQNMETGSEEIDGVFRSSVQFPVNSDVTVFCNVSNKYGAAAVTFNIKPREFPVSVPACVCLYVFISVCRPKHTLNPFLASFSIYLCLTLFCLGASSSASCCRVRPVTLDPVFNLFGR